LGWLLWFCCCRSRLILWSHPDVDGIFHCVISSAIFVARSGLVCLPLWWMNVNLFFLHWLNKLKGQRCYKVLYYTSYSIDLLPSSTFIKISIYEIYSWWKTYHPMASTSRAQVVILDPLDLHNVMSYQWVLVISHHPSVIYFVTGIRQISQVCKSISTDRTWQHAGFRTRESGEEPNDKRWVCESHKGKVSAILKYFLIQKLSKIPHVFIYM
jgi:hypothetical protein